jgi:hypothetical protein
LCRRGSLWVKAFLQRLKRHLASCLQKTFLFLVVHSSTGSYRIICTALIFAELFASGRVVDLQELSTRSVHGYMENWSSLFVSPRESLG